MEASARVLLGGLVAIVLVHYLQGGRAQVKRWANYAFTGRGADAVPSPRMSGPATRPGVIRA